MKKKRKMNLLNSSILNRVVLTSYAFSSRYQQLLTNIVEIKDCNLARFLVCSKSDDIRVAVPTVVSFPCIRIAYTSICLFSDLLQLSSLVRCTMLQDIFDSNAVFFLESLNRKAKLRLPMWW